MSKYAPLLKYSTDNNKDRYILSYEEIENIMGLK